MFVRNAVYVTRCILPRVSYKFIQTEILSSLPISHHPFIHHCCTCRRFSSYNPDNDPAVKELLKDIQKDFGVNEEQSSTTENEPTSSDSRTQNEDNNDKSSSQPPAIKYDPNIIYDFDEELMLRREGLWEEKQRIRIKDDIVCHRGLRGVYDVEELIQVLRENNGKDVAAIYLPEEYKYVEHMVICSGLSTKHIDALGAVVKKTYKRKRSKDDPFVIVEGKGSDWLAMDMGNIALHIMSDEVRKIKDLESLWTIGAEVDEEWENPVKMLFGEGTEEEMAAYSRELKESK